MSEIAFVLAMTSAMTGRSGPEDADAARSLFASVPFPVVERFETFGMEQGMPCHKIHAVLKATDGRLWVGTWEGLMVRASEGGAFRQFTTADGLTHKMILSLAEDPRTGDLWVGTMRGLNRVSGGRITGYLQTDSGFMAWTSWVTTCGPRRRRALGR
jgi:hypothetical protein